VLDARRVERAECLYAEGVRRFSSAVLRCHRP
jgi:hypothetical protein